MAAVTIFVSTNYAQAQTLIPASDPDYRLWPTPNGFAFLSTAMIESPATGQLLSAIAYRGHYGSGVMLQLDEEIGSAVFINIQYNLYEDIDVALIDRPGSGGLEYRLGVVYKRWNGIGFSLMMEVHNVDISSGGIIRTIILPPTPIVPFPILF